MTVEYLEPGLRLKRLVGAEMPKHLPSGMASRAASAAAVAIDAARDGILEAIEQLWQQVDAPGEQSEARTDEVYFRAHDLRGLCGSCNEEILAGIADALCTYIEETRAAELKPRANIVWLHASSMRRAAQEKDTISTLGPYLIESLCAMRKKELEMACPKGCSCSFFPKEGGTSPTCKKNG